METSVGLSETVTGLGLRLMRSLAKEGIQCPEGNLLLCPASLGLALGVLSEGADGRTKKELIGLSLGSDDTDRLHPETANLGAWLTEEHPPELTLRSAQRLYVAAPFLPKPTLQDLAFKAFRTSFALVDFIKKGKMVRDNINSWLSEVTEGRYRGEFVGELMPATSMVVVSVVYLKGRWESPFDPSKTKDHVFRHLPSEHTSRVRMMSQSGLFLFAQNGRAKMVGLRFGGAQDVAFFFWLPTGRWTAREWLKSATPKELVGMMREAKPTRVMVGLPRFAIQSGYNLGTTLRDCGVREAFMSSRAGLKGVAESSTGNLHLSTIVQRAVLAVDEAGVEVAEGEGRAFVDEFPPFKGVHQAVVIADRPFAFAIATAQHRLLFQGIVSNPAVPLPELPKPVVPK